MIDAGSTTIWELWSPMALQCHAWSTTPTFDLSTYILGVTPLVDGFARVQIAPQPVDLAWAEGTVPTPQGAIQVRWEQGANSFDLALTAPAACAVEIVLPWVATQITVNGRRAWGQGQSAQTVDGLTPRERALGQFDLVSERGGTYQVHVVKL